MSVGTKTDDEKTKEALKEAVATQDQETIERAVEQARNSKGQKDEKRDFDTGCISAVCI